jgi:Lipase (class 3)
MTINNLSACNKQFEILSHLHFRERLYTTKSVVSSKYASPNIVDEKRAKFSVIKIAQHLISLFKKFFQAISRLFRAQSVQRNLNALDSLLNNTIGQISSLSEESISEKPDLLRLLGRIKRDGTNAVNYGLVNLCKTCETGASDLKKSKKKIREVEVQRVKNAIVQINQTILPKVTSIIEDFVNSHLEKDKENVTKLFTSFFCSSDFPIIQTFSTKSIRDVLNPVFGEKYVTKIMEFYHFSDVIMNGNELHSLTIGLMANLRKVELENLFKSRNSGLLNLPQTLLMQLPGKFGELNDQQICHFLEAVRTINIKPVNISPHYASQLTKDIAFMEACKNVKNYSLEKNNTILERKKFGFAEYLSRFIIYGLFAKPHTKFPSGVLFPIYDKNQKLVCRQARKISKDNGLYGVTVLPVISGSYSKKTKIPIQVVYCGTIDRAGLLRDISLREKDSFGPEGPGRKSFHKASFQMISKVKKHLSKVLPDDQHQYKIQVMGHSLGGTDAMRMVAALARDALQSQSDRIARIDLMAFNAPALENDVARKFIEDVRQLRFPFRLRYLKTHNDALQQAGKVLLGYRKKSQIPLPKNLECSLIKFHRRTEANRYTSIGGFRKHGLKKGLQFVKQKYLHAHSTPCFWNSDREELNKTFISSLHTNSIKDLIFPLGENREQRAILASAETLNYKLQTRIGRILNFL